jgi:predicted phage terminase large subunit-like protein
LYQFVFPTRLSPDRNAVAEFETTQGGYRLATSIGGRVTGWGANIIILDEPISADDAYSDSKRKSCNDWYDSSLPNRLNRPAEDAIIIVGHRSHADDLVAHVQRREAWKVRSLAAVAEKDEYYLFATPYGRRSVTRKTGDVLHAAVFNNRNLEAGTSDYHFAAQYQQNPQPPFGFVVQRKWLTFYEQADKPQNFDLVLQSWDTASKMTELSDYSVCTTWGIQGPYTYLLDVFRQKLEFPALKNSVLELARLWDAATVLIEDKSSGTQLIQELRENGFSKVEAAPSLDGEKVMRLRAQTAKIQNGFVLFPRHAPWLESYVQELLSFPNSKHDDQIDSTVFALAWRTLHPGARWNEACDENANTFLAAMTFQRLFGGGGL